MGSKEISVIREQIRSAMNVIEILSRPSGKYGYDDFYDGDIRDLYYNLNDMVILLGEKMEDK